MALHRKDLGAGGSRTDLRGEKGQALGGPCLEGRATSRWPRTTAAPGKKGLLSFIKVSLDDVVLAQEIAANRYKMLVSGLAEAGARQHGINFIPSGPGVPTDGGEQGVRPGTRPR